MCTIPYTQQITPVKQLLIQTESVCSNKAQTAFAQHILRCTVTLWVVSPAQSLLVEDPNDLAKTQHPDRRDLIRVMLG